MISRFSVARIGLFAALAALAAGNARATEIFIHRPGLNGSSLAESRKIVLHGDIFFHYLSPSTFPSYNDLSGPADRWNMGFQNYFPITPTTTLMAQMVAHDDGAQRTKFDWHFHLRQALLRNLVVIIGHDSDHDSEHQSYLRGKPYYTNRNYVGIGIPFEGRHFYIEPFTWFFHHSNQRAGLDMSGERLRQEYGLRASLWADEGVSAPPSDVLSDRRGLLPRPGLFGRDHHPSEDRPLARALARRKPLGRSRNDRPRREAELPQAPLGGCRPVLTEEGPCCRPWKRSSSQPSSWPRPGRS